MVLGVDLTNLMMNVELWCGDGVERSCGGPRDGGDGVGPWRKRNKKSKIPPELFLRAVVRPFTYRNLVKEIVLTRHAILDGEIGA